MIDLIYFASIRERLNCDREQVDLPLPATVADLLALLGLYSGMDSRHLNFYGPPQTITTSPYAHVLAPDTSRTPEVENLST